MKEIELMTLADAAKSLGVSYASVYKWVDLGLMEHESIAPVVGTRDHIRITPEEVERIRKMRKAKLPLRFVGQAQKVLGR